MLCQRRCSNASQRTRSLVIVQLVLTTACQYHVRRLQKHRHSVLNTGEKTEMLKTCFMIKGINVHFGGLVVGYNFFEICYRLLWICLRCLCSNKSTIKQSRRSLTLKVFRYDANWGGLYLTERLFVVHILYPVYNPVLGYNDNLCFLLNGSRKKQQKQKVYEHKLKLNWLSPQQTLIDWMT